MTTDTDKPMRLVFLDMEMTGLNPETDRILEVAAAIVEATPAGLGAALEELKTVTPLSGKTCYLQSLGRIPVARTPCVFAVVRQTTAALAAMNPWSLEHHSKSGLTELCLRSAISCGEVENSLIDWLQHCGFPEKGNAVLAGNTIHFDRAFIRRWMPDLDAFLHYRLFDISTLRQFILMQGAVPSDRPMPLAFWAAHEYATKKQFGPDTDAHRALLDVIASIEELQAYSSVFHLDNGQ